MKTHQLPLALNGVRHAGAPFEAARRAMILVHGRGGNADDILSLHRFFFSTQEGKETDIVFFAPEATAHSWYPYSFLSPRQANEPGLSSGLELLQTLVAQVNNIGIPSERIALAGFSQGACLTLEFAARSNERFGGVIGFSGGLIGESIETKEYSGNVSDVPVFLGCSDRDPHIPKRRVEETAQALQQMGADVRLKFYPNMPHTIIQDEIEEARIILERMTSAKIKAE